MKVISGEMVFSGSGMLSVLAAALAVMALFLDGAGRRVGSPKF
jgi:hypothetical protein